MTSTQTTNSLAKAVSLLFHPLLLPLYATVIVVYGEATSVSYMESLKPFVVMSVAGMTVGTPIAFWLILRCFGVVARKGSDRGRVRILMLFAMEMCLLGCGGVFAKFVMLFVVRKLLYTAALVVALLLITEKLWPLSHHTTAMGALLGVEWVLLYVGNVGLLWPFIATIVATGAVCSARLSVASHSPLQIYGGLALGIAVGFATFILL